MADIDVTGIRGPYLDDLLAQPAALRGVAASLRARRSVRDALWSGAAARGPVVLTGMGSSLHALYPLHLRLSAAGVASFHLETAELLQSFMHLARQDATFVVVSQSGESGEVVCLLDQLGTVGTRRVVGVTNRPESGLGRRCAERIDLAAGPEATVSCKTYLNTLAALAWLGEDLTGGRRDTIVAEIAASADEVARYLHESAGGWRAHAAALAELVAGVSCVFVTGRGASLATAWTGGLVLKESTQTPCEGMSAPAFRHGPFEMSGDRVLVLVARGDEPVAALNRSLVEDVRRAGGRAFLIGDAEAEGPFAVPGGAPQLRQVFEMLPVQMLSLAIAARDGREAGRFSRAEKITTKL